MKVNERRYDLMKRDKSDEEKKSGAQKMKTTFEMKKEKIKQKRKKAAEMLS